MSLNAGPVSLEGAAREVIDYLKGRAHEEKPHIAVLGPPSPYICKKFLESYGLVESKRGASIREESYEEEDEEVSEETFSISRRAWYLMGIELNEVKILSDERNREISITYKFVARTAPGREKENYADIKISITLRNESDIQIVAEITRLDKNPQSIAITHKSTLMWNGNKCYIAIGIPIGAKIYALFERTKNEILQIDLKDVDPNIEEYLATRQDIDFEFSVKVDSERRRLTSVEAKYINCSVISIVLNKLNENALSLKSMIICLGGYFNKKKVNNYLVGRDAYMVYAFDAENYRWALGHLFEVEGEVTWRGYDVKITWDQYGIKGAGAINCLLIDEKGKLIFRDWHIAREDVYRIKTSNRNVKDSINGLIEAIETISKGSNIKYDIDDLRIIGDALLHALERMKISKLFEYQEKALIEITPQLLGISREKKHFAIVARTAGGKTYAFLLPVVFAAAALKTRGYRGCKAILFYPTKALANDQADELARLLWFFNSYLRERGREDLVVSMGVLHGNIKSRFAKRSTNELSEITMIKCPIHDDKPLEISYVEDNGIWIENIRCSEESCQLNTEEENRWINKWIKLSREAIYSDPPDILITDEDMINVVLMRNPAELTIIGYSKVKVCRRCGTTYASISKRKCSKCGSELEQLNRLAEPVAVILDEAHMLRGSFGIQTFYLLKRFEQAIRAIHGKPKEWRPTYIISSATIHKPDAFAASLLGSRNVRVLEAKYEEKEEGGFKVQARRIFVFVMPKAYEMQATCVRALSKLYKCVQDRSPQTIVFVNTLAESNELCRALRDELENSTGGLVKVGGHTTDYEQSRVRIEQAFSKGEYNILVATRTLEVGVDYGSVDAAVIYGMPFYISDFTQRIGRAGRNRDALVFVIFDPQKPIDYYYYHNYKLLCDPKLRDEAMSLESYTIKSDNIEAIYRTIKRAIFDYLAVNAGVFGIEKLYEEDIRTGHEDADKLINILKFNDDHLFSYLQNIFESGVDSKILENHVREMVSWLVQEIVSSLTSLKIKNLFEKADEMFQLHNLRRADKEVEVIFPPLGHGESSGENKRKREISVAIRHYMKGQITSYRGMFFIVNMIEGDTEDIENFLERDDNYAKY
jgi:DEAD/DEAH box helicase domain-containing protein